MRISKADLGAFGVAALVYMLFVSGGVVPYSPDDSQKATIKAVLLVLSLFALGLRVDRAAISTIGLFLLVGLGIGLLALMRSADLNFSIDKIDGAILCSAAIVLLINASRLRHGIQVFQVAIIWFSMFVLVATVLYKLQFGFFDRSVRFFLNGPIVYGWLMGGVALLSFHMWRERRQTRFIVFFGAFVAALLWTESKGSILAFFSAFGAYLMLNSERKIVHGAVLLIIVSVVYFFLYDPLLDFLGDSRLSAGARFLSGQLGDVDEGSFGIRAALQDQAINDFRENPWFGIGIGGFKYGEFVYPHNQHLEIFAELGGLVGIIHVFFVLVAFVRAPNLIKALIVLFAVGGSFSGDASYLRFLYVACLLAFVGRPKAFRW